MADQSDIDDVQDEAAPPADDVHAQALRGFDEVSLTYQEERALCLSDRRFVSIAGAQWEGDWEAQFENSIRVEVNKTAQGVEKIISDYRSNRVTVNFRGVGRDSSEETAELLDGLFRADLYNSKGQQAADNAFEEAVSGGFGAWRLTNVMEDDYDPDNEGQRIAFEAIVDADQSVYFDANARLYDKSDAREAWVITAMSRDAFVAEYGAGVVADWPDRFVKPHYDWFTPDVVRVAEYYRIEDKAGMRGVFQHRATGEERKEWLAGLSAEDRQAMEIEGWRLLRSRKVKRKVVKKWVMSGAEILRGPKVIAGDCIPIIPMYGKRWFIDNMERCRGHVRLAKDPQRIYNAQISKLTETAALAPLERPIFTPEQVAGHEGSWARANIDRAPYSLINPLTDPLTGQPLPPGQVGTITPPTLSPVLGTLIQITAADIAELTSADDGSTEVKSNVSAEAMDIAATRTDAKTGIYMDNMRQSMQRCGEVYLGMARDVYFEEGREVETMGDAGERGTAILAEPHTDEQGRYSTRNDLARGKYRVISDVTEATATRRDKTVKTLLNGAQIVAPFDQELAGAMTTTAMLNMDGEGITDLQEWMRARAITAGLVKPTPEEQEQIDAAQQQQEQPDPQSEALLAMSEKDRALAGKAVADTKLSEAKTVETLAKAQSVGTQPEAGPKGIMDRVGAMFRRKPKAAA